MLVMSLMIGILSVATSYYWWTIDWWRPMTLTGTRVGIEDFIMGFSTGGIMATLYEIVFKRAFYKRKLHHHITGALTILFLLAQTTMWLFWGVGLTSFQASATSMALVSLIMLFTRRDLLFNSLISGLLMACVSSLFYLVIALISPGWIHQTYLSGLSGMNLAGVPIEEFIFWFLSGMVFGPFYEYWQGERLRKAK